MVVIVLRAARSLLVTSLWQQAAYRDIIKGVSELSVFSYDYGYWLQRQCCSIGRNSDLAVAVAKAVISDTAQALRHLLERGRDTPTMGIPLVTYVRYWFLKTRTLSHSTYLCCTSDRQNI